MNMLLMGKKYKKNIVKYTFGVVLDLRQIEVDSKKVMY